jgi:phage terminase Nu1 subunit (DNA packaging protein)
MTTLTAKQANILNRLGEASGKINKATGYADIDKLKMAVKLKEEELRLAREQAKEAKEKHAQAMEERAASGVRGMLLLPPASCYPRNTR